MEKKKIIITCLAFASSVIASCVKPKENAETESEELVYEASVIKNENVASQLTLPGELEGYYETGILAKVNGYIKSVRVDIGDKVQTGQLLVELEAPELVSQLATAYSEYETKEAMFLNTKGKLARLKQTNRTPGAVSPYDMDLAKTSFTSDSLGVLSAKTKYESVRELTNYLKITAPFDGIITDRALAPGAFVGPNDKQGVSILKLKKQSKLRLHIAVPEKHLAEISTGETVTFRVKSFPDEMFSGKITRLSKNVNLITRSEMVEVEIDNRPEKLLPGMYAIASIPIKRQGQSLVVPKAAVVTTMEMQYVIKIKNGNEASYLDVEKGEDQGESVEVFGKLYPGDTILNTASDEIKRGTRIKIIVVGNEVTKNHK
jgi:membrane fusion protein (multidrug efflux system)